MKILVLLFLPLLMVGYIVRNLIVLGRLLPFQPDNFLKGLPLRGIDPQGDGSYGAPRGNRKHNGLDVEYKAGSNFVAPFDCKIIRHGTVQANKPFTLIEVQGIGKFSHLTAKYMYIIGLPVSDKIIRRGKSLGIVQNLHLYYPSNMINHVHIEIYDNGTRVNPELYL